MGKVSVEVKTRYNKKVYEQCNFRIRKGGDLSKEIMQAAADRSGLSLNAWIVEAVIEKLEREKAPE